MGTFENRKTKYIPVVFFIILFLAVAGVLFAVFLYKNDKGGNILVGASPDTSAFQLYYYDGAVYYGDTDLSFLWREMEGSDEDTLNVLNFPNAGHLSVYHSCFLLKADELPAEGTEGMSMTVQDIGTSEITVLIANNSGEDLNEQEIF